MAVKSLDLPQALIGTFVFLISIFFILRRWKSKGSPPGPVSLPIIGNTLQIGNKPHITFQQWAKIYGPIMKINVAMNDAIVLSDPQLVKELFSDLDAGGRWSTNPISTEFTKGPNGIVNAEGEAWNTQRKFTLRALKEFGYLTSTMEDLIISEVQAVINWFKKYEGKVISGNRIFNAPVVNSLWHIVSGQRCDWENSKPYMHEVMDEFMEALQKTFSSGLMFAPYLRFIAPEHFGWRKYYDYSEKMMDIFKLTVKEHQRDLDPSNLKDLIDHHLVQIQQTTDPNSSFYKENGYKHLLAGIFDLFIAGSETTANTLSWTLLYLSHHQDIQEKLHSEIVKVIGTSRLPRLADKSEMPYTEALIYEILRVTSVAQLGVMHSILKQKSFHGYTLEPGTIIFANIYAIHHDPKIWGDPENFRPERFLNKDQTKVVRNDALIPFSEGKRKCMGEGLARDSLFLFITGIFQTFKVLPDPERKTPPDFEEDLGIVRVPKPFQIVIKYRDQESALKSRSTYFEQYRNN